MTNTNKNINFEDIDNLQLSDSEREFLVSFYMSKEWKLFQGIVENYVLKKSKALVTGTFSDGVDKMQYLDSLRGFTQHWKILLNYGKNKDN